MSAPPSKGVVTTLFPRFSGTLRDVVGQRKRGQQAYDCAIRISTGT
jgi:hypothetical protein